MIDKICIIGLGYIGLPLAVEFGKEYSTIGFDINGQRIKELIAGYDSTQFSHLKDCKPTYRDFRAGDVMHFLADISKANKLQGYEPSHRIDEGLKVVIGWYVLHNDVNTSATN